MDAEQKKLPQIANPAEITPELFKQYVLYVRDLRHNQKRWFRTHNYSALEIARKMEEKLDLFNEQLLDINPKLF